jgi:branched-chain amino acid aminotransferase
MSSAATQRPLTHPVVSYAGSTPSAGAFVWQGHQIHRAVDLTLSTLDQGFTVGNGTFETLIAKNGKPFALQRHWKRLQTGCSLMHLAPPSFELMSEALHQVLEANALDEARLRFTVSAGPIHAPQDPRPTYVASAVPLPQVAPTEIVVTVPWTRNESGALTGIKSISYAENIRALHYAKSWGAGEALMLNTQGQLCEGTTSNIFLVIEGELYTPPLSSGCLPGITREIVIEQARANSLPIHEQPLMREDLEHAEEVFLTSSIRGVQPVAVAEGLRLQGAPGPVTLKLSRLYKEVLDAGLEP